MARTPAYARLADELLAAVTGGQYALGDRLPTEAELCASSGLSRGTVRQALQQLERLGMITRRAGDGSRVVATSPVADYQPAADSADDASALLHDTRILRPQLHEVVAGRALARRLGVRPGTRWHHVEGVRVPRGRSAEPVCWSEQYVRVAASAPAGLRETMAAAELAGAETEQIVTAELLDPHLAERLATDSPVALVVLRRHRDSRGRLLSIGIHTHPGDRYSLRTVLASRAT